MGAGNKPRGNPVCSGWPRAKRRERLNESFSGGRTRGLPDLAAVLAPQIGRKNVTTPLTLFTGCTPGWLRRINDRQVTRGLLVQLCSRCFDLANHRIHQSLRKLLGEVALELCWEFPVAVVHLMGNRGSSGRVVALPIEPLPHPVRRKLTEKEKRLAQGSL